MGLVHQPLVREFAGFKSRRTGLKGLRSRVESCMSPSAIHRYSPDPEFFRDVQKGVRHTREGGFS